MTDEQHSNSKTRNQSKFRKNNEVFTIKKIVLKKNGKKLIKKKPIDILNKTQILELNDFSQDIYNTIIQNLK